MASTYDGPTPPPTEHLDQALGFMIPGRHARGRVVRIGPALDSILSRHAYPPAIERVLAEALTLTALLGSLLKDAAGQLTLQAQTEGGVIDLLVCDYRAGVMRGYVRHDAERLAEMPVDPSLFALFGPGYLAITFDQVTSGERYQGIVPLEGASLAEAAERYFAQSEQIPSLVRLSIVGNARDGHVAGGLMIQHLPEGEEGRDRIHTRLDHPEWDHVAVLASTAKPEELSDPTLPLTDIVWRLFHEEDEVRVLPPATLTRGCRCNPDHFRDVLARFPEDERIGMADDAGVIEVACEFCSSKYGITLESLAAVEVDGGTT
ncbi:Hsp33 family molecular chaperone HslO [Sphingomonas prati]|uniref:Molecular chaperone Hsp33 n=1 Tax=Sphingomonas prati TaxID=1843237 RepID=A0A7W9BP61_9SPHN|nr:Hsp33 family molecular chaperone HslO [Sphingomonas prati]MBB5727567.1 molecular chaperone Hsp33 [Sphingomonas prati]GGE79013.1 33 kDa chaperonin [Sphingomonas prati]